MFTMSDAPSYQVLKLALSKAAPFTLEGLFTEVRENDIDLNLDEIKKLMDQSIDNGLIVKRGVEYSLSVLAAR